jgi:hypothetical protein
MFDGLRNHARVMNIRNILVSHVHNVLWVFDYTYALLTFEAIEILLRGEMCFTFVVQHKLPHLHSQTLVIVSRIRVPGFCEHQKQPERHL